MEKKTSNTPVPDKAAENHSDETEKVIDPNVEIGGPKGLEPTRFGDWEKGGRCTDF